LSWLLGNHRFAIPFIASAMDGVVDVPFAIALGNLGGLAVVNLEGLQTRYERPQEVLAEIAAAPRETVTELMQGLYQAPIREDLVGRRVAEIKAGGAGHRRAPGDRDHGLRRGTRRLPHANWPLRADHHRRRHAHGW